MKQWQWASSNNLNLGAGTLEQHVRGSVVLVEGLGLFLCELAGSWERARQDSAK